MGNWIRCVIFIESNLCFLFKIVFNTGLYIRLYEVKKNFDDILYCKEGRRIPKALSVLFVLRGMFVVLKVSHFNERAKKPYINKHK